MPIIYESDNGVWYKKQTPKEIELEKQIEIASSHAQGGQPYHDAKSIQGMSSLSAHLSQLSSQILEVKAKVDTTTERIDAMHETNKRISFLEKELFYHSWLVKNTAYSYIEFDTLETDHKLIHSTLSDGLLIPDPAKKGQYSIYRTIKFIPQLTKCIERYMVHIEYKLEENAGLIAEISFNGGETFHTVLSTVEDKEVSYHYQYPDFCDIDNSVPDLDATSFILRFRMLSNSEGRGVHISSYGILIA